LVLLAASPFLLAFTALGEATAPALAAVGAAVLVLAVQAAGEDRGMAATLITSFLFTILNYATEIHNTRIESEGNR
jgi:hypothetical protein